MSFISSFCRNHIFNKKDHLLLLINLEFKVFLTWIEIFESYIIGKNLI